MDSIAFDVEEWIRENPELWYQKVEQEKAYYRIIVDEEIYKALGDLATHAEFIPQYELDRINRNLNRNPDEVRKKISTSMRSDVWAKTGGFCWYCDEQLNPHKNLSVDHVIPVSKGGDESLDNLVPCCRSCNTAKSNRDGWSKGCRIVRSHYVPSVGDEQIEWGRSALASSTG